MDAKIKGEFAGWPKKYASSDVIIVGAGPAGLMAAMDLASSDLKILVIDKSPFAGGRLWVSDYLISASMLMSQVKEMLDELKITYKKGKAGLFVTAGPSASAKLVSAACDAGVKILNLAEFSDLICGNELVEGIMVDWKPQLALKDEVNGSIPVALKSQIVVDTTGSSAQVCKNLINRGIVNPNQYEKIDIHKSEELLLEKTGSIYPGLFVGGMAAAALYGIPAGGLTLCSMLLSGRKLAQAIDLFFAENYIMPFKKHKSINRDSRL